MVFRSPIWHGQEMADELPRAASLTAYDAIAGVPVAQRTQPYHAAVAGAVCIGTELVCHP